ncbi:hypothetical protein [Chitinophaga sancti]|uniref:Uncharacterized protein n=1 Tax=Chitinophaga sancti TaxID=1004 RepID=A0A1K1M9A5_9BACT|nr:hypothetical protein [Chitinophaga sancti]WQD64538.1 hypothetical protein U0033_09035 [Chitinophaga sancti]WQG89837.1 hypothetical protein SR876_33435 [Chitinophaga sancti]SFW19712.1 hypothetical protein SAMN05661012_00547 [Chitinophaga sancti]
MSDGKNNARRLDNLGVTDYQERVGPGLNTLVNFGLPILKLRAPGKIQELATEVEQYAAELKTLKKSRAMVVGTSIAKW